MEEFVRESLEIKRTELISARFSRRNRNINQHLGLLKKKIKKYGKITSIVGSITRITERLPQLLGVSPELLEDYLNYWEYHQNYWKITSIIRSITRIIGRLPKLLEVSPELWKVYLSYWEYHQNYGKSTLIVGIITRIMERLP